MSAVVLNPHAKPFGGQKPAQHKKARRGKVVEVVVSTPWYAQGIRKSEISLEGEVAACGGFMKLGEKEKAVRLAAVNALQDAAGGEVKMTVYGSLACGTATENSCADVWVRCEEDITKDLIGNMIEVAGMKATSEIICGSAMGGFVQVASDAVKLNLTFSHDDSTPIMSNAVNQAWTAGYPHAPTVLHILREVLDQTGNLDVCNGGLSSYALYAMVISVCKVSPQPSPHALLLEVCRWFGTVFDFTTLGVSTTTGWRTKTPSMTDTLFVEDPLDADNNLAAGCSRLFAIKVQFQHCFKTLQRWVEVPGQGATATYKGRTPLSGIISHKRLWPRAEKLSATSDTEEDEEGSESSDVLSSPTSAPKRSLAQIFAVTSYDSLCSLDDPAEGDEGDELLCDVGRTALSF